MSSFTVLGTSRLGIDPNCVECGAGGTISFNWDFLRERSNAEDRVRISNYLPWLKLRRGQLFRCKICEQVWHLDGAEQIMTHVSSDRLPLVLDWNRAPISLSEEVAAVLADIGATPPDIYGNGIERRVTPCSITTQSCEVVDPAMICVQLDAPVQDYMQFRLGHEVSSVQPSPHSLPLDVRLETSRAHEMRMGFSPTLIELPDGKKFVLNGMTSFLVEPGYKANEAKLTMGSYFKEEVPPTFTTTPAITYFIVDGDPSWVPVQ